MLGERILTEFGDQRTGDTLTRWLAHHIAGLLDAAEQADIQRAPDADERAARARAAILDLWEHRSAWPSGWPPPRSAALVRLLDDLPEAEDAGWGVHNLLGELHLLHHRLLAALTDLAMAGDIDDIEEGWLSTFGQQLSANEIEILTRVASAPRRLAVLFAAEDLPVRRAVPGSNGTNAEADDVTPDHQDESASVSAVLMIAKAYREAVTGFVERHVTTADRTAPAGSELGG